MFSNRGFCVHNCHPSNCIHCRPAGYSSSVNYQQTYNNNGFFGSSCNNAQPFVIVDPFHHDHDHHHNHHHHGHHGHW